jgi:REP element-mobilizing transposase RayT
MDKHHRRSIRLKHYDYSQPGSYFITICTHAKTLLFGEIVDGEMQLNELGKIVEQCLSEIPVHFPDVILDKQVIMPNHVHMIIVLWTPCKGTACRAPTIERFGKPTKSSIPTIIRSLKSAATKRINQIQNTPGQSVWQRNYYEHIIRDEMELNHIRRYVINNPPQWEYDRENCNGLPIDEKRTFWSKFLNEFD